MNEVSKAIIKLCRRLTDISMVALFAMMLLVVADVLSRTLFNKSVIGAYELIENLLVVVVCLAYGNAQVVKRHIKVEIFIDMMPEKLKNAFELGTLVICFAFIAYSTYLQIPQIVSVKSAHTVTMALMLPQWPFNIIVFFGLLIFSLVLLLDIINQILKMLGLVKNVEEASPTDANAQINAEKAIKAIREEKLQIKESKLLL